MCFDPADGSKTTQSTVKTGSLAAPPQHNPQRDGFLFDGWTHDGQPFDFRIPILQDTTLKAQWTKITDWTLNPDHGPASGTRLTISPPDMQEPKFASIQTSGNQFVGLTGDGRIYTWTQDGTPNQVPFPAQAPDGFHYLQAAADSHRQAALGSDQHIYTWTSQQAVPTILDTGRNNRFTSISINDDPLLAIDLQGQVHTFQTSQPGNRNPTAKPGEQAAADLPGQAQAVTAAASGSQILALDADGQAWRWNTNKIGKAKPTRIKQDQGIRIIQVQSLSQGILLLDANGQANYLADSTTSAIAVSLPDGGKAGTITGNGSQAMITDTNGQVWAWKPGKAPMRTDNGNQHYIQATEADSRIMALDRQGDMYTWNLGYQSNPDKTARVDTSTAPTLESANLDSQPLKLTKTGDVWQTPIPARKPGPATILITGRQDGQPFTRSLNYTVDQQLARDTEPNTTHTVTFNTDSGTPTPADQQVSYPYGRVQRPSPDPTRDGYQFDGWFTGSIAYDFSKPVTTDLTLTAHWTFKDPNNTWRINPDKGSQLGNETTTIAPPASHSGIKFNQVSGSKDDFNVGLFSLAVGSDGNAYAWGLNNYGQLGDGTRTSRNTPVMVRTPDRKTYPDLPEDFTYVQVSAGDNHSLALGSDGYVYTWGNNKYGQLGNNTKGGYSSVPVRVRDPGSPTDANKGLKAVQISAGANHSLVIDSDGYVYAWGWGAMGQLGNNTTSYDGNPFPLRVRDPANPDDTSKGLKAIQVSGGWQHSLAVGRDGYAYAWGLNNYGQLGNNTSNGSKVPVRVLDPASPTDANKGLKAIQVSGGGDHSLAIGEDGNTWSWGRNDHGELGNNGRNTNTAIPGPVQYPKGESTVKAVQVNTGLFYSLAIGADGNVWAWGQNNNGQLGNNTTNNRTIPIKVFTSAQSTSSSGPWLNAVQISAGTYHSLAIGTDGNAKAWGNNSNGQLGDNTTNTRLVPVPVVFNLTPVITGVRFDQSAVSGLTHGNDNSVTVLTPIHVPGTVTVSVDYTLGGAGSTLTDTSLKYTYLPAGVLPRAGGEGILLALAAGMTGMGGVLASRRHRRETRQLLQASHE